MNGSIYEDQIARLAGLEALAAKMKDELEAWSGQAEFFRERLEAAADKKTVAEALKKLNEADFAM